ncbi:MAG: ABC transporter permease [Bacteroidetes bacterium]|nr:ABC transporter permease [Bacteroidota bacterium]
MLINYLQIALRNLSKYKVFSFINVAGMAVSLGSCLLIALFVWDEWSFDSHHPDGERTYRVYNIRQGNDGETRYLPIVPYPFASYMQKDFPEIESTLRMLDNYGEQLFELGDKRVMEGYGMLAEPNVFDMLTLHVIAGDENTALVRPGTVALSEPLSRKYFGERNPIGETIRIDEVDREITAVFAEPPVRFHLKINYLLSLSTTQWSVRFENNWQRQQIFTYLKLKPGTDARALDAKLLPFVEKYAYPTIREKGFTYVPHLQNIRDIHLHSSNFEWEVAQRGNAQSVYILAATGVMVLIIACLNFINLSTARAVKRMKEVGVRKVVGAARSQLIFQFVSESVLITFVGLVLAVGLAELALPAVNLMVGKTMTIPFGPYVVVGALLLCIVIGILAGGYPALHLSGQMPYMLGRRGDGGGGGPLRQSLVVLQFMLSFFLITGSLTVLSQNDLLQNMDLGFDRELVVVIPLTEAQLKNQETTRQAYLNHQNVVNATIGFGLPGDIIAGDEVINPERQEIFPANIFCVDNNYIPTMGMKIIAGRNFSPEYPSDSVNAFILNETALRMYGYGKPEEALGKRLNWKRWDTQKMKEGVITGVVQDFNFRSLREKVSPAVLQLFPRQAWKMAVRIKPDHIPETIAHLRRTYESLEKEAIFSYNFLQQNFDDMYKSERRLAQLFTFFTYLAIMVACLGLYGLVEFSVNQRAKEISIRKVFGASIFSLLNLLTRRYLALLFVAFIMIIPFSYYFAVNWLNNFAYHVEIEPLLFIKGMLMILLITVFTISYQSVRAALGNPAHVLKNE